MTNNLYLSATTEPGKRHRIFALPPAEKNMIIFFTPRSGSSWLTDILGQTQLCGRANELFNPNFMPSISRALQAENLDEYIEASRRHFNLGKVFSFEITMHQLKAVFASPDDFRSRFRDGHYVWLIRKDIISQAVSLTKLVNKNISHSPQVSTKDLEAADISFNYSEKEILKWINHIRNAEVQTEVFFSKNRIQPIRLAYEDIISAGARRTSKLLLAQLEKNITDEFSFEERHRKIGTTLNIDYAQRFRRRNWLLAKRLNFQRRHILRNLHFL